ncbi:MULTISPECIES: phage repressor protein CI [Pseudescherichia]|uniref:phage repressor protein CI n=1 Tax=Pseudescherichia TaxID=2055880 RepID=UPI00301E28A2
MGEGNKSAQSVLSRMRQAYGVGSNVELADRMNTPKSTVSNWVSRDSVPFRYVMVCSQETGADLDWLLKGELANASLVGAEKGKTFNKGTTYFSLLESGGQAVLHRLLLAYGFTMQKQLGDLLGLSSGTISTWVRRNHFPGDVVVACALDTGVDLKWLATGEGNPSNTLTTSNEAASHMISIPLLSLENGRLENKGNTVADSNVVPNVNKDCVYIVKGPVSWLVNMKENTPINGLCLLDVDGVIDIYNITRLPGNKITVSSTSGISFQCMVDDVTCRGTVIKTIN